MKNAANKVHFVVFMLCFVCSMAGSAQGFDNIVAGFKSGDASAIAKHFEGNVEITIKTGGTSYSKSQAEMVLKNFFAQHKAKTFTVDHDGTSPQGAKYFIGKLTTATGNYRTYVYAKTMKNELVILEIRFEEQ